MIEVFVPRENVNDESVTILSVKFKSSTKVKKGDSIFEIETTKTNVEIDAPADGLIHHEISVGDTVLVGSLLCRLDDGKNNPIIVLNTPNVEVDPLQNNNAKLSKAAIKRADELGVDTSVFKNGLISVSDIERQALVVSGQTILHPLKHIKRLNNKIVILGGGGHAKMCIDILLQRNEYQIVGIVDSQKAIGTIVCGIKVIGDDTILEKLWSEGVSCAVNGIGSVSNPVVRKVLYAKLKNIGYYLPNLVHPSAVIEPSVKLGEGNQVMMGACVGSDVVIGDNCIVNSGSIISHDCILESNSHVAPGAVLAGSVIVGDTAVVGMGVTVYMGVNIGRGSIINNGLNIFRNINPNEVVKS
ncbi:NeuD/PglB/VioB family sugar acetyltransferase [Pseudomonas sp. CCI3.2]|uniref:NeuD/PglB/VioB family sugar acetyltransferase n=1 Tax=unclassified Pseudomonas TaxID=196821 RepID=UPI002AC9CF33|nr:MULTISPECIES: NeuD/PglB/VioB family sugar acetyltransferase [unclassified Pseudomonas]MEB0076983.1 NeuD/PglB/VioB family sugar acetyltransferase [Pseudomonas sp. MH10out]MEB0089785.1 NeuD/PglB/VioB family sugar acetyltransferase [Pseudomonas sp. CCI4.2]MEB0102393.1 NeuD/PglB/VioB family sugar acetyltransferase [Pseudomonas sp. CCI3.2]MEB0121485.1 NeuD/PglB/VioB family sugar acetyltransferase [Pseudomonas sp. CCI1.2]MEB0129074.1 NeuD/PglB/VioB family sugar acetyltransferase [Pseudomonas sp. 